MLQEVQVANSAFIFCPEDFLNDTRVLIDEILRIASLGVDYSYLNQLKDTQIQWFNYRVIES